MLVMWSCSVLNDVREGERKREMRERPKEKERKRGKCIINHRYRPEHPSSGAAAGLGGKTGWVQGHGDGDGSGRWRRDSRRT